MEMEDVAEYTFATTYLDSYDHWVTLCECRWFKPVVQKWRHHLEMKVKSKAFKVLQETAELEGKDKIQANKALLTYEKFLSKPLQKNPVGRPKKEKVSRNPDVLNDILREFNSENKVTNGDATKEMLQ